MDKDYALRAPKSWNSGDQILVREWLQGKLWSALPFTVVADTPELIALYIAPGTPFVAARTKPTVKNQLDGHWALVGHKWRGEGSLWLSVPGASYSIELYWHPGRKTLDRWKVNLEDPLRRTRFGFDYKDRLLDIVISPDKSEWEWKDEDEVTEAVALGLMSAERARHFYAEGERGLKRLLANEAPFDRDWAAWNPDEAWSMPKFPDGWDVL
jgi:hypothetical protein